MNTMNKMFIAGAIALASAGANAGVIDTSSTLLDDVGATQLENWLGQGDLDWTSIWYGEEGASSTSWHSAVDGVGPTVSIYQATNYLGEQILVGGFTTMDWSGSGYKADNSAFLFNLTTGEHQAVAFNNLHSIYTNISYFATFGGGHDLHGGNNTLGNTDYTYSYSYDQSQGRIDIEGDTGSGSGSTGAPTASFNVQALETFTFTASLGGEESSSSVPLPASAALLGLGLLGFVRRKTK